MEDYLFAQLESIKDKVIFFLSKYPKTKEDDNLLYSYFIIFTIGKGDFRRGKRLLEKKLAYDFLINIANHRFPEYNTVSRARRKIQETMPHLRGKNYGKRHESAKFWRENINNPVEPENLI